MPLHSNAIRFNCAGARNAAFLLLVVGLMLLTPTVALAHAYLDHANPAPGSTLAQAPTQLRLTFSEDVDPSFSQVRVLNAQRAGVDRGDSRIAPDDPHALIVSLQDGLSEGVYTVAWRTLSADDGHSVSGAYTLTVGAAASSTLASQPVAADAEFSPETAVARWWLYLAASLVFGPLLAWQTVFRPLLPDASSPARKVAAGKTRRLALIGAVALVLGTLYAALAQATSASALPLWGAAGPALGKLLASGHFAVIWWPRLAVSIGVLAVLTRRDVTGLAGDLGLAAMPAVLLTSSLGSHAAAVAGWSPLAIAADWLHFMAVAAWLGGLASMALVLPAVARAVESPQGAFFASPVARFSNVALTSVVAVALTGTFQAWLELGSWQALVQTAYGLSVSAKAVLTVVMLGFGAFNLLFAHPTLAARLASRLSTARWTVRGFRRSIRAELAIGLVVLGVAAVVTGLAPGRGDLARQTATQPTAVDQAVNAPGLSGRVGITPAAVGQNRFSVELPAADPSTVERVQLTLTYLDGDLGSEPVLLTGSQASPGTWQADSAALSQPGQWQADLLIRRQGQDDVRSSIRFAVNVPGVSAPSDAAGAYPPVPWWLPSGLSAVAALAIAGAALVVLLRNRARPTAAALDSESLRRLLRGAESNEPPANGVHRDVVGVGSRENSQPVAARKESARQ